MSRRGGSHEPTWRRPADTTNSRTCAASTDGPFAGNTETSDLRDTQTRVGAETDRAAIGGVRHRVDDLMQILASHGTGQAGVDARAVESQGRVVVSVFPANGPSVEAAQVREFVVSAGRRQVGSCEPPRLDILTGRRPRAWHVPQSGDPAGDGVDRLALVAAPLDPRDAQRVGQWDRGAHSVASMVWSCMMVLMIVSPLGR